MNNLGEIFSTDDILSVLNHSNSKSIIIEGNDDLIFFRRIEDEYSNIGVSILPVGGREKVISVFNRRDEISNPDSVIFFVDKDFWVYSHVPDEFRHSAFRTTDGFSIENDLYIDGNIEGLLTAAETLEFQRNLAKFTHWYALATFRVLGGNDQQTVVDHPRGVIQNTDRYDEKCALSDGEFYPNEFHDCVISDYKKLLRGKSLLGLILMQLSSSDRAPKHSRAALMEIGFLANGELMQRIRNWVSERFRPPPG